MKPNYDHKMYGIVLWMLSDLFLTSSQPFEDHLCSHGCELLYNEELDCGSHHAFVPNGYINNIDRILTSKQYICFNPYIDSVSNEALTDQSAYGSTLFNLQSYVLIWQAIIIAIVVPFTALLLLKLFVTVFEKISDRCCKNSKCKCKYCLYCCSARHRQQQRNRQYDMNRDNGDQQPRKWIFGRKNNEGNNDNDNDRPPVLINGEQDEYEHVPLNDDDHEIALPNVLEEVSVEHNGINIEQYLQVPGAVGTNQNIELSFSSQGLRRLSYGDVV